MKKKDVGMGVFVQCLYALSLHLGSVVFGTAIPTSLNIFGKCFSLIACTPTAQFGLLLYFVQYGSVKSFRFMFIKTRIVYIPRRKDFKYMNMHCITVCSTVRST